MTNIAIENGPFEIVDFPINNMVIFHSYVSLPEGSIRGLGGMGFLFSSWRGPSKKYQFTAACQKDSSEDNM